MRISAIRCRVSVLNRSVTRQPKCPPLQRGTALEDPLSWIRRARRPWRPMVIRPAHTPVTRHRRRRGRREPVGGPFRFPRNPFAPARPPPTRAPDAAATRARPTRRRRAVSLYGPRSPRRSSQLPLRRTVRFKVFQRGGCACTDAPPFWRGGVSTTRRGRPAVGGGRRRPAVGGVEPRLGRRHRPEDERQPRGARLG